VATRGSLGGRRWLALAAVAGLAVVGALALGLSKQQPAPTKQTGQPDASAPDCVANWKDVPTPPQPSDWASGLWMTALSSTDIWAAEEYGSSTNGGTLMAHFDGARWSVRPSPDLGPSQWAFSGLAAVATNDIWAVGFSAGSSLAQGLIEHYDGTSWTVVPGPRLNGVTLSLIHI